MENVKKRLEAMTEEFVTSNMHASVLMLIEESIQADHALLIEKLNALEPLAKEGQWSAVGMLQKVREMLV